jgi:hypothetical protein
MVERNVLDRVWNQRLFMMFTVVVVDGYFCGGWPYKLFFCRFLSMCIRVQELFYWDIIIWITNAIQTYIRNNQHLFFHAKIVTRTLLNITSCVGCLSCAPTTLISIFVPVYVYSSDATYINICKIARKIY